MSESIHVIQKGGERVTVADKNSALSLINALAVLDCTEPVTKSIINGNKQELDAYEVKFLDNRVKVLTLGDAEKVLHWMLAFGCIKVGIEKLISDPESYQE